MDETEAKALALVNAHAINRRSDLSDAKHTELRCALLDAVQSQAATEARHAAELREQAERFSEAVQAVKQLGLKYAQHVLLDPFILPAPDPLVEAEKLISTLRADEREGYAVAGQAAETISNLVATLRKIREAGE